MRFNPLHSAALLLAILNALAGISLLLLSGWFIAACALAGLTSLAFSFNYMVPAATIRLLALVRIATGYGEKAVGHDSLLTRLHRIRMSWFTQLMAHRERSALRSEQAEHLNQTAEDSANQWLTVIHPNTANAMIILSSSLLLLWLTPFAFKIWLSLLVAECMLMTLLWYGIQRTEQKRVTSQADYRKQIEHLLANAPLWLLSPVMASGQKLNTKAQDWLHTKAQQRVLDSLGESALTLTSGLALSLLLAFLPSAQLGMALLMLPLILCLALPEWLGASTRSIRAWIAARKAKSSLHSLLHCHDSTAIDTRGMCQLEAPFTLTLAHYGWHYSHSNNLAISASFQTGQLVWLQGSSGSGKSSLLLALAGLMEEQGKASLNHTSLLELSPKQRQEHMHYVEQFPYVLAETLAHNLRLAKPNATMDQLVEALLFAELDSLSAELHTWVGESGRQLSGGEVKRLGLARAWLKDAPIWLLDEPFEGLDDKCQNQLANKLVQLSQHKLIVVASHLWPKQIPVNQVIDLDETIYMRRVH